MAFTPAAFSQDELHAFDYSSLADNDDPSAIRAPEHTDEVLLQAHGSSHQQPNPPPTRAGQILGRRKSIGLPKVKRVTLAQAGKQGKEDVNSDSREAPRPHI
jgi:hypothetical protein